MTATGYPALDDVIPDVAIGYLAPPDDDPGGAGASNLYAIPARGQPDGGAFTTAADLVRFLDAFRDGRLVGPAWRDEMLRPRVRDEREGTSYGLAWWVSGEGAAALGGPSRRRSRVRGPRALVPGGGRPAGGAGEPVGPRRAGGRARGGPAGRLTGRVRGTARAARRLTGRPPARTVARRHLRARCEGRSARPGPTVRVRRDGPPGGPGSPVAGPGRAAGPLRAAGRRAAAPGRGAPSPRPPRGPPGARAARRPRRAPGGRTARSPAAHRAGRSPPPPPSTRPAPPRGRLASVS